MLEYKAARGNGGKGYGEWREGNCGSKKEGMKGSVSIKRDE
jgi:hypothetical protein